ncbi:MAG: hypothetical protein Q4G16_05340 [Cruoricaptor ignavus]|nr:hypothetical protein [Cruoricaptor ignavus]
MSKFIIGSTLTVSIENYSYGSPCIQMDTPMSYPLYDLVQMIKMWTNYTDTYDWIFSNPYEDSGVKSLSLKNNKEEIENTAFHEFRKSTPYIICNYGPIEIQLEARGFLKYRKVYPTIYQAVGYFPTEQEFLNNIKSIDIHGKYTIPSKTLPSSEHLINNDLIQYGEKLKNYFKTKYKISNEIVEGSAFNENKLIAK